LAGELDDRWLKPRKRPRREESPDTTPRKRSSNHAAARLRGRRATRLVTPGDALRNRASPLGQTSRYGQCHREYTACVAQPGDILQENLPDIF